MTDFLILTDKEDNKRLVAIDKIIHIDFSTGGGSRLYLIEGQTIQAKESVATIADTIIQYLN